MGQDPQHPASPASPASTDRLLSTVADRAAAAAEQAREELIIPVIAEELVVLTMEKDTGGVRAVKTVREQEQIIDQPLLREQVTVERKTIKRMLDVPAVVRQEGDTLIIPVMEEVLVVQRHFLLKEEIHIRKVQTQVHEPQRFIVRSEEVKLEQLPAEDNFQDSKQPPPAPRSEKKGEVR